jgi:hypothetical protein
MFSKLLLTSVVALASVTSLAARDGVVTSSDGRMTFVPRRTQSVTQSAASDAGLVTIFDNIGKVYPKGAYSCCDGFTVTGPDAPSGPEFWVGAAFTPSANHTVTVIKVALGLIGGSNEVVLSVNNDNGGVPGTAIKSWNVKSLPEAGTCCTVMVRKDEAGIPITAGTQYWIVVQTSNSSNIQAAWDVNDTDQVDSSTIAFYCSSPSGVCQNNNQWTVEQRVPGPAFAVLGSE